MRFFIIIFVAGALMFSGCSRRQVEVSVTNRSNLPVVEMSVCNKKLCQNVGTLAPGASIRVAVQLNDAWKSEGDWLSLTYWIEGRHQEDAMIHYSKTNADLKALSFAIGTNYLVEP